MFWNTFNAIGNDVVINLSEIRGAEIHRAISGVESNILSSSSLVETGQYFCFERFLFNENNFLSVEVSTLNCYWSVQKCLSRIAGNLDVSRDNDVIPFVLGLLEEATDRLTKDENTDRPVIILPEAVEAIHGLFLYKE